MCLMYRHDRQRHIVNDLAEPEHSTVCSNIASIHIECKCCKMLLARCTLSALSNAGVGSESHAIVCGVPHMAAYLLMFSIDHSAMSRMRSLLGAGDCPLKCCVISGA